jgi:DNA-binding SARP family transcriptional activator
MRPGGKHEALLSVLALHPVGLVPRETLLEAVWPDVAFSLAVQSLNTLVYSLSKMLSDAIGGAAPVLHPDGSYRLNLAAGVGVDTLSFDRMARDGDQHARAGRDSAAIGAYGRAIELYTGDLYTASDARAVVERERLRARYHTLLACLAEHHFEQRAYAAALDHSLGLLASDPTREDAHRMAMRCYVRRGERAQALRQYRVCERILRAEFDARPEPATISLFERVRHDPGSV